MRVLVTGASGLLGTWLLRTTPEGVHVTAAVHTSAVDCPDTATADLRVPGETARLVARARPDVVVHAAYRKDRASIVDATANLVQAAAGRGVRFVHLSTESVFQGDGRVRAETETPDPVWDYGRWKAEAERVVLDGVPHGAVVRLPLLVSLDPPDGVVRSIRAAVAEGGTVGWYRGERRPPAYAADVAGALWRLLELPAPAAAGVWHLPGPERLSRAELGARAARALGVPDPGVEVPAPSADQRPRDLALGDDRARDVLGWQPRRVHAGDGSDGSDGSDG